MNLTDSFSIGSATKPSHKRKCDLSSETPVVVLVDAGNNLQSRLQDAKIQLLNRRNQYYTDDVLLERLQMIHKDELQEPLLALKAKAEQIQATLDAQIQEAQAACQQESSVLVQLTRNLQQLEQNRNSLLQDMDEMDQRQMELQQQIALHQQEAAQEIDYIDSVEEERKREVPRLKHSISLYASTTGIKWDFSQEDILAGSVVSQYSIMTKGE